MPRSRAIAVQLAVSAAALAAVVWWASRQPLPDLPAAGTALPALGAGLALYALATLLRGERWRALLADGRARCSRADAYALTTIGYMGNNALPARAGDVMKAFLTARRTGAPAAGTVGTLVAERMLDAAALGLVFVVLVTTLRLPLGVPGWTLALAAAALAAAAGGAWLLGRRTAAGRRARDVVVALVAPSRRLWSRRGAALLLLSMALWLVEGGVYAVVGGVAGIDLSLLDGLYVMALANMAALVPAAPGYVGTFDAAVLLGVGLVTSAGQPAALAYVVLVRFLLFVPITLVGLVALVTCVGGRREIGALLRESRPPPQPQPASA
ncbi:MAG TPA: lysylphosphatidylglycerol synthase transmembrane domain-containing protein [Solirubrobacteraceae bacterium]|nr:lysylphosphatidylglycerol synthase transmembrane domain-containing protein [Solirubrobacteraceae bacterium]